VEGTAGLIETRNMKSEARLLNIICIIVALAFVSLALVNALFSVNFLTIDNLFVTMVCMVMALMFAVNPVLYLKEQGRLPIPFQKRKALKQSAPEPSGLARSQAPPLLDAKGRAVPPDVRSMVANMKQKQP
jgi:hypothetical protein